MKKNSWKFPDRGFMISVPWSLICLFKGIYLHLKDKEITGGELGMVLQENKKAEKNKKKKKASHDVALAHIDGHFPYQSFLGDKMLFKSFSHK